MRRKRFQKGSVRPRKHGRTRCGWPNGGRTGNRRQVLGRFADLPKSEAEARMAQILEPTNAGAGHPEKPVYTFGVFVGAGFPAVVPAEMEGIDPDDH